MSAILGRIPTIEEYMSYAEKLDGQRDEIYRYLNFNELPLYTDAAASAERPSLT